MPEEVKEVNEYKIVELNLRHLKGACMPAGICAIFISMFSICR
jgi:hypothetical protein